MKQYFQWDKGVINLCEVKSCAQWNDGVVVFLGANQTHSLAEEDAERFVTEYKQYIAEIERDIEMPDLNVKRRYATVRVDDTTIKVESFEEFAGFASKLIAITRAVPIELGNTETEGLSLLEAAKLYDVLARDYPYEQE